MSFVRWQLGLRLLLSISLVTGCSVSPSENVIRESSAEPPTSQPLVSPTATAAPPQSATTPNPDQTPSAQDAGLEEIRQAFDRTLAKSQIGFVHSVDFGFRATSGVLSSADVVWTGVANYPGGSGWVVMNRGDFGDSHEIPEGASDSLGQIDAEIWLGEEVNPVDAAFLLTHLQSSFMRTDQSLTREDGSSHWWAIARVSDAQPLLRGQLGTIDELTSLGATAEAEMTVDIDITADGTIELLTLSLSSWWQEAASERGIAQQQWVSVSIEIWTSGLDEAENECPDADALRRDGRYCEARRSQSV